MHEFRVDGRRTAGPGSAQTGRSARIGDVLTEIGSSLTYTYDLGDGWEHSIVLEKRFSRCDDAEYPVRLDGPTGMSSGRLWGRSWLLRPPGSPPEPGG